LDERYRLDKRIAAGGVGQVWLARDLLLERPVAVKVLRSEYADHPDTLDRFRKEAKHAGALSHPHVAQVYDYGPGGPEWPPYLVMEFVDGPSLADILAVDPVDPAYALDVIAQAADGLSAAHRAGLVHRDVKPGNILIGPEGLIKVTDFGIAHVAGQAPITGPHLVMGTTQYMAPERIAGDQGSPASDLYGLGIVLHECLTGVPPYEGAPADVMAAHFSTPLPPLPPGQPPEIEALIGRLTAKDPAERISDARELALLAADLRDAMAPGRFASLARTGALSTANTALAAPAGMATGLVSNPSDYSGPSRSDGPAGSASPAGGYAGPGGPGGPTGTAGLTGLSDEWAVPPRMSLPASPTDLSEDRLSEDRRRRRTGAFAVGAVVVAGGALAGLLVTGALREAPAANPSPAGTPTGAAATPTGRPAGVAHATSPAVSTSAAAVPGVTSPQSGTGSKAPAPTGRASATASANPTPSTSAPASPSVSPSGTGSGSPTGSPSGSPSTSPSSPPSASPTPTACLLGICL
jgi:eukaryotic-like serine/threonine-protein kinase